MCYVGKSSLMSQDPIFIPALMIGLWDDNYTVSLKSGIATATLTLSG